MEIGVICSVIKDSAELQHIIDTPSAIKTFGIGTSSSVQGKLVDEETVVDFIPLDRKYPNTRHTLRDSPRRLRVCRGISCLRFALRTARFTGNPEHDDSLSSHWASISNELLL